MGLKYTVDIRGDIRGDIGVDIIVDIFMKISNCFEVTFSKYLTIMKVLHVLNVLTLFPIEKQINFNFI